MIASPSAVTSESVLGIEAVLKWAAGSITEVPEHMSPDEDRLFRLLCDHRLVRRFLYRFMDERSQWCSEILRGRPEWCSKDLLHRLLAYQSHQEAYLKYQWQTLVDIASALKDLSQSPLVVIKGFSTF